MNDIQNNQSGEVPVKKPKKKRAEEVQVQWNFDSLASLVVPQRKASVKAETTLKIKERIEQDEVLEPTGVQVGTLFHDRYLSREFRMFVCFSS